MPEFYCPKCGQDGPFTQDTLDPRLIKYGYYRCEACGYTVKPVPMAKAAAVEDEKE